MSLVLAEIRGSAGIATLKPPQALNALNDEMLRGLTAAFKDFAADDRVTSVVLRSASPRAFCSGGDIRAVRHRRGDRAFMDHIYRIEYELDYLIHSFPKPVVALVNGLLMGGGCGISLHARHRVATPDLVFAMPETGIGFFPDVGGSVFLGQLPEGIGTYLGLTGARLAASEALALGLVDVVAEASEHELLLGRLADNMPAHAAVAALTSATMSDDGLPELEDIARHFNARSTLAIVQALERAPDARLRRACCDPALPRLLFSLEITSRLIAAGRSLQLHDALAVDFRVAQRFMERDDYFEGVRAVLVDRDKRPDWCPARLEDVDPAEVAACFAPLDGPELWTLSPSFPDGGAL